MSRLFRCVVLAALLLFGVSGCTAGAGDAVVSGETSAERAVIDEFRTVAEDLGTVGAFLLVRTSDGAYSSAYGENEDGTGVEPTGDTVFRIGSNTKTFTGTVLLQLVDEGLIALDDPVSDYWDDVPHGDAITIEMLLNMRSGLYSYTESEEWAEASLEDTGRVWEPEELLRIAFEHEPHSEPGESYYYSNTNTVLLGAIAERLTGRSLEDLFAERLFEPLGLASTRLPVADDVSLAEPYAHGYVILEGEERVDSTFFNPSWGWAAGAAVSTAEELADWAEALTSSGLLSEGLQERRLDSVLPISEDAAQEGWGYGLGIAEVAGLLGHTGQLPGYNSFMGSDPTTGVTVVIWANFAPTADGRDPANAIADAVVPLIRQED
ncbi:beta-lactamase family protein [Leucobacter weissii]|uniref:Beta-lactamase family protein n=1 Tax=Leucobacter weissii TaxID=1983706 RepID=A0A939MLB7_9MICO|nr:serine hydrolase domain-containing protein [Leucobacter weissii]MBO1902873.1 beta-lactamase family protein [Leucobacter weissii]